MKEVLAGRRIYLRGTLGQAAGRALIRRAARSAEASVAELVGDDHEVLTDDAQGHAAPALSQSGVSYVRRTPLLLNALPQVPRLLQL